MFQRAVSLALAILCAVGLFGMPAPVLAIGAAAPRPCGTLGPRLSLPIRLPSSFIANRTTSGPAGSWRGKAVLTEDGTLQIVTSSSGSASYTRYYAGEYEYAKSGASWQRTKSSSLDRDDWYPPRTLWGRESELADAMIDGVDTAVYRIDSFALCPDVWHYTIWVGKNDGYVRRLETVRVMASGATVMRNVTTFSHFDEPLHVTLPNATGPLCDDPNKEASVTNAVSPKVPPQFRKLLTQPKRTSVAVTISSAGALLDAMVYTSSGNADLDELAVTAARQSTYAPEYQNCRPVQDKVLFVVNFQQ